ncbi:branched-chain amino acid ABC transporter permease [Candidatus Aerophobetes bacterium]|nr:branched-chain amino acid ABC transporter permease [Candidatus Aerophobetes bacterium]
MIFVDIFIHGLGWASIYAVIAVGFSLIFSASKVINLCQGEFVILGGLIGVALYSIKIPLLFIPLLSALVVGIVGITLERIAISPAKKASPTALIIITIALSIILKSTANLIWGSRSYKLPSFFRKDFINLTNITMDPQYLLIMGICAISIIILTLFLRRTRWGRSLRACSMDPIGARIVGVSPEKMRSISFCISAGLSGMIGTLIAPIFFINSDYGLNLGLKGFCAAILGGMGNIPGAIAGGFIIGLSETMGAFLFSTYKDIVAPLLMIIVLYMRPRGIMGGRD